MQPPWMTLAIAGLLAVFLFFKWAWVLQVARRFGRFVVEVREELKQVSWPNREELVGSGLVVFVGVALMASFISVWDFVLSKAVKLLLR